MNDPPVCAITVCIVMLLGFWFFAYDLPKYVEREESKEWISRAKSVDKKDGSEP